MNYQNPSLVFMIWCFGFFIMGTRGLDSGSVLQNCRLRCHHPH